MTFQRSPNDSTHSDVEIFEKQWKKVFSKFHLFYFDLNQIHLHPQQLYFPFPMHHASLISPLQQNKNPTAWGNFSKTKMLTDQFKASRWNKHQSFRPPIYIFCSLGHFAPNLSCVFHPKVYFTAVPIGIGTQLDSTDTWALIINAMAALALHHVQPAYSSLNLKLKEKLEENWFNHKSKLRKWGNKKHEILLSTNYKLYNNVISDLKAVHLAV